MKKNVKCLFCKELVDWRINFLDCQGIKIPIYVCDEHLELGKSFTEEVKKEIEIKQQPILQTPGRNFK